MRFSEEQREIILRALRTLKAQELFSSIENEGDDENYYMEEIEKIDTIIEKLDFDY